MALLLSLRFCVLRSWQGPGGDAKGTGRECQAELSLSSGLYSQHRLQKGIQPSTLPGTGRAGSPSAPAGLGGHSSGTAQLSLERKHRSCHLQGKEAQPLGKEQGDSRGEQGGGGTVGTPGRWWHSGDTREAVAQQGHQHGSRKVMAQLRHQHGSRKVVAQWGHWEGGGTAGTAGRWWHSRDSSTGAGRWWHSGDTSMGAGRWWHSGDTGKVVAQQGQQEGGGTAGTPVWEQKGGGTVGTPVWEQEGGGTVGTPVWEQEGSGIAGTPGRWWHSGDTSMGVGRKVVAQWGHQHRSRKVVAQWGHQYGSRQEGDGTVGTPGRWWQSRDTSTGAGRWWHNGDTRKVVSQCGHQHGSSGKVVGSTKDACKVPLPLLGLHPEGFNRQNSLLAGVFPWERMGLGLKHFLP
ncbi:uncharacterized transmembrane protein DDB_G0289901-like isoform X1 [Haemorhous mexicanus]|uniref:uncharacterized transmembrane protein DDB_G0289901-like isoform X1 n=1 Tax=Haemorhous mexicanus TaxID=30427 RepID=UPI0028BE489E|nr:uncharacterized transmembrane protein DDB_G0289901-like isoform X1 [Haemorhous mexicanus]